VASPEITRPGGTSTFHPSPELHGPSASAGNNWRVMVIRPHPPTQPASIGWQIVDPSGSRNLLTSRLQGHQHRMATSPSVEGIHCKSLLSLLPLSSILVKGISCPGFDLGCIDRAAVPLSFTHGLGTSAPPSVIVVLGFLDVEGGSLAFLACLFHSLVRRDESLARVLGWG
jgi:hypothetical protein